MSNPLDEFIARDPAFHLRDLVRGEGQGSPIDSPLPAEAVVGSEQRDFAADDKSDATKSPHSICHDASAAASRSVGAASSSSAGGRSLAHTAVAAYRAKFRSEHIPASYSAYAHLADITVWGLAAAALACYFAGGPLAMLTTPRCLGMTLLAFGLANYIEYYAHRYKLHNPFAHTRHSHHHHRYFTEKVMEFDDFRDAHAIFFPMGAPKYIMGVALPVLSALPLLITGVQAGAAFACTLALYYVTYEYMHLSYHSPPSSFLGRLPGVSSLRRHHQAHHAQQLMGKFNFNITWPICDWLLATTYKGTL